MMVSTSFVIFFSAIIWQFRKRHGHVFKKKLHTGALLKIYPSGAYSSVFYYRWQEKKEQLFIRKYCHFAPTFVDVGANVGIFSALVIDCFESFYLFEPSPLTFNTLSESCALNPNTNWHLHNIGISDQKGELMFVDEGNCSGTNRFLGENIPSAEKGHLIEVTVDTLDNCISPEVGTIILKVDVEGFEEKVFKGAERILSSQQVKLVMFERLGRTNLKNICYLFKRHDYVVFSVCDDGSLSTEEKDISKLHVNLFATPTECFAFLN